MTAGSAVQAPPACPRVAGRSPLRWGRVSGVWRPRVIVVTVVGFGALVLAAATNIGLGDFPIPVSEVLGVLAGGGDHAQQLVVYELRLPRTLAGLLVGAALAMSGAITQAIARNPLASPDILGVTEGASAAAVTVIVLGAASAGSVFAMIGVPFAALLGGVGAGTLVYALAWRRGIEGYRLVLVGVGIGALGKSVVDFMLVKAQIFAAAEATVWLNGSLSGRSWEHVVPVAVALAVLVPLALLLAFGLGALQFSDDTARGLGVRVNPARSGLILVAVALAAIATSAAGPIFFVALVVPQICLRLVGSSRPPLLASAVFGALLTVGSDLIARTVFAGGGMPVGIVTAIIGAPYLLYLLVRANRKISIT